MVDRESNHLETNEVALTRFQEVLQTVKMPQAQTVCELITQGLIRVTTDDRIHQLIRGNRTDKGCGFAACFNSKAKTATILIAIDTERFCSRGPLSLEGSVTDLLKKFVACEKIVADYVLQWSFLEDSQVEQFLKESGSGDGHGYKSFAFWSGKLKDR